MASIQGNQTQKKDEEAVIPMSPSSQSLNSSIISLTILAVVELETILDEFEIVDFIRNVCIPSNARFSCIVDVDEKGVPCWKKVNNVKVEDHITVPIFPKGLSIMDYDEKLREYVSKIAGEQLKTNQPLWEIHVVKYPNLNGEGSVVFKISHAIGDGYSIISTMYAAFRRVDDPSLPLALPNISVRVNGLEKRSCWNFFPKCMNSISDMARSLLKASVLEDSKSAVRSGKLGVEFEPIAISSISISMDSLKRVKSKVGGTVNDLITGVIYYTIHLYMLRKGDISRGKNMNLLVMFNMRMLKGYKNIEEMMKANICGNHVASLVVPVPCISGEQKVDPLYFVSKAKKIMERKKNSFYLYVTIPFIKVLTIIRGSKGLSKIVHTNFKNTTAMVTNLIGPKEKLSMAGHPVGSCYFIVAGIPQSLSFTTASWMGQLRLTATMEKNFIDSQLFYSCMQEAFENIFQAACGGDISC
ncbi:hypothetical protein AQUCO_00700587v1 [Aquilegia coerulea]|uniref:Uncharacterized protein n=1 Tax=Aquilegia coerulea TaxID=218851 RepID=A0A2G5EKV8_AQUCA|nr:hypothetical protein AQUCO_00700587v1 [Aquilegia coerulea]